MNVFGPFRAMECNLFSTEVRRWLQPPHPQPPPQCDYESSLSVCELKKKVPAQLSAQTLNKLCGIEVHMDTLNPNNTMKTGRGSVIFFF